MLALGASYVAARPGGPRSTFGYHRAEILAAMANAIVLLVVCGYLAWAGVNRLRSPSDVEVEAGLLIAFAAVGLAETPCRSWCSGAPRRARSTCAAPRSR